MAKQSNKKPKKPVTEANLASAAAKREEAPRPVCCQNSFAGLLVAGSVIRH